MRVPFACTEEDLNWAGLTCSAEEPCPIYLELTGVVPNGSKLVLSGNLHSASGTLNSVLLLSTDGAASWNEPARRIRGASLDQLQFYDFQNGWAAGETLYPLPRDPFVLITTDGGSSWSQQAIGEEGSAGSIQRFWFDSPQHGELVIDHGNAGGGDRYASFETRTGGQSWDMLGTSGKLPAIKRAPLPGDHSDFRVRTSTDGKSYQVEKRDGDRWTAIASFLVKVADCQPGREELKEPPAETSQPKDAVNELKIKTDQNGPPPKKKKP